MKICIPSPRLQLLWSASISFSLKVHVCFSSLNSTWNSIKHSESLSQLQHNKETGSFPHIHQTSPFLTIRMAHLSILGRRTRWIDGVGVWRWMLAPFLSGLTSRVLPGGGTDQVAPAWQSAPGSGPLPEMEACPPASGALASRTSGGFLSDTSRQHSRMGGRSGREGSLSVSVHLSLKISLSFSLCISLYPSLFLSHAQIGRAHV